MANKKISSLNSLGGTPDVADIIPITDVSDTTGSVNGTTKKVTVANLVAAAPQGDLVASNNLSDVASASTARTNLGLGTAATTASSDYATAAQGALADSATQPGDLGTAAALNVGTADTNVVQLSDVGGTVKLPAVDGSQLLNLPGGSVDGTQVTSTGETGGTKFLREDGDGTCSFQTVSITDENLRGTDNPHIGAFPNQSLKVIDNPSQSVMVITDVDGNLEFLTKDGANVFVNTPSSRLALAKGFSIQSDGTEPDIEAIDTDGTTYSVISGDTDTKGANGLPTRQGFNFPDIGANPSPLLISGGSIS
jgi:hypothetical protein